MYIAMASAVVVLTCFVVISAIPFLITYLFDSTHIKIALVFVGVALFALAAVVRRKK
jgi:hypothetical protein